MQLYSGIFRRVVASVIDFFVIILLFMFFQLITETPDENVVYAFFPTMWVYFAFQESSAQKATVGKQAVNLIVTDLKGNRISFLQATKRFIVKILAAIPLFTGLLPIIFTSKKQAFHDIVAKTVVLIHEE